MSSDDHLDNSSAALLQPVPTESELSESHNDNGLVEQPVVEPSNDNDDNDNAPSSPTQQESGVDPPHTENQTQEHQETPEPVSSESDIQPVSTPPVELKIENENQPASSENPDDKPEADRAPSTGRSTPPSTNHDVENPKEADDENAQDGGDTVPLASNKPSRSARLRTWTRSIDAKKARMVTSIDDISSLRLWKGIGAEFLGTMLLTMIGCGSCISLSGTNTSPVVQIALSFGLSVATIVWAIGHVSGGHINPAVTLAMLATRKISLVKAAFFVIFQLIGAVVGAGVLYGLTPSDKRGNLGSTLVNDQLNVGQAVGVEIFITFVLVFVVFSSVDNKRRDLNGSTPLTIGLSVTMCHLFAIEFTGSSMNTARSFGPAVVIGKWEDHWVYWVGPILGGIAAGIIYDNIFAVNASFEKAKACMLSSDYDDDKYQAQKMKIRVLEEEPEEDGEDLPLSLSEKGEAAMDSDPSNV